MTLSLIGFVALAGFAGFLALSIDTDAHHWIIEALRGGVAMWIFSALVQSLPEPDEESGKFYRFVFRFVNLLGANLRQAGVGKK